MARKARPPEQIVGRLVALPRAVAESKAFIGASHRAKAMLWEFAMAHNGSNNGHITMSTAPRREDGPPGPIRLSERGWTSADAVHLAILELMERGLILQTRQGGLGIGPSRYALTWHRITSFVGLDIEPRHYHPGVWALCNLPATARRKPPAKNHEVSSDHRSEPVPNTGAARDTAAPTTGAKKAVLGKFPAPTTGNKVHIPSTPRKNARRIVGKKGVSGRPAKSLEPMAGDDR